MKITIFLIWILCDSTFYDNLIKWEGEKKCEWQLLVFWQVSNYLANDSSSSKKKKMEECSKNFQIKITFFNLFHYDVPKIHGGSSGIDK